MKLRDSQIYLNDDLEEFTANIQPPITEENYSEILRCSERPSSESNDEITEYQEVRLHLACTTKTDLRKKMSLAEKCADTFSYLDRNEQSKHYYLKQVNLNQKEIFHIQRLEFLF